MSFSLKIDGYEIRRGVFDESRVWEMRAEADRVAMCAGSACVRHLRSRSEQFDAMSRSDELARLIPSGLRPVRSILFDKTEAENWPVLWHQDLTIAVQQEMAVSGYGPWSCKDGAVHVQPPVSVLENMVTIRVHLDDTPATNGALRVMPGSHRKGKIGEHEMLKIDQDDAVTCECGAGDVLVMSPLILHSSRRAENPARRRVLHFEYARAEDLDARLEWFEAATA